MKIDRLILGAYQTNCYILRASQAAKNCLVIDTGLEADELIDFLERHRLNPAGVVLTHGHIDHIAGTTELRRTYPDIKVYIHKLDAGKVPQRTEDRNLTSDPSTALRAGFCLQAAGIKLEVLHTPGHTPGGICLYSKAERIVFTDDTLFAGGVGRTDMPGGSMTQLINSIKGKLFTLPDETICYPGHGPQTTIAQEKAQNPFLQ